MQIIPVLDIRRGLVVHAQGGERTSYQPIQSILTQEVEPERVIRALLDWYPFPIIYIADLDAIEFGESQLMRYQTICRSFPDLQIWLDIGIRHEQDFHYYSQLNNVSLVIGSETLTDFEWLNDVELRKQLILSMDRKAGQFLGNKELLRTPESWPERLLAMQLDNVGGQIGPASDWIAQLQSLKPEAQIYAAGGVRDRNDLEQLKQREVAGALIATAIHKGMLTREDML